ncbi:hypothetical protein OMP43_17420 [Sphingomonas sp. CBMAI 2297]|uniref:DUF7940 domain-containing protein n=1 Tax=Sphingomonas sp. CBMAI 2297 TaxID=2991720 RepID=UPI002453D21C|nr:hypothetical protein [Sphingomonas sp. CBMAI 2297]MDH4745808.1 hypothetical protein [Sphingomonas sp. CBMAI 2297]
MNILSGGRRAWRLLTARVRTRLVDQCRAVWRRWSVQIAALSSALSAFAFISPDTIQSIWSALPPEILERLPRGIAMSVPLLLSLATIAVSFLKQEKPVAKSDE